MSALIRLAASSEVEALELCCRCFHFGLGAGVVLFVASISALA